VLAMIAIEKLTGRLVSGPDIITRGFVFEDTAPDLINNIGSLVSETLKALDKEIMLDPSLVKAKIRSVLKKYLRNTMEKSPMIVPIIFEI
jgi:ribonuclease J